MKEKSHRVPEVCEKSGNETLLHTTTRRLDGYRLYTATHVRIREACGGQVRHRARQLGWGAVLLQALDRQLGLTEGIARCLDDRRQPGKIQHELLELVQQRVFGIACGYADCNDAARLATDAMHKVRLDREIGR